MNRWIHRQKNLHIAENPASFSLLFYWQFDADCEKEGLYVTPPQSHLLKYCIELFACLLKVIMLCYHFLFPYYIQLTVNV